MFYYVIIVILLFFGHITNGTYVVSWGSNSFGQLGIGSQVDSTVPKAIPEYASRTVSNIRIGLSTHFAMMSDGAVFCAGNNFYGQLGTNNLLTETRPVSNPLAFGLDVYPIGPQTIAHNPTTKNVLGWGLDSGYMYPYMTGNQKTPRQSQDINFVGYVISVSTAWNSAFVILNGGAHAAGKVNTVSGSTVDTVAKLGTGATADQPNFVRMSFWNSHPLLKIFASDTSHVCALSKSYSLYCWGKNNAGQLGVGHTNDMNIPQLVSFFDREDLYVAQLITGDTHTIALTCGGKVYAWGNNARGNLGLGTKDSAAHPSPSLVASLSGLVIIEIASAANSVFARNSTNYWHVWGAATNNMTLMPSTDDILSPTPNLYFSQNGLTRIAVNSKSTFAFAWADANPPMMPSGNPECPYMSNECEMGTDNCGRNTLCIDTERGYRCVCPAGFTGNGISTSVGGTGCNDIDECALNMCVPQATCTNELGSFWCTCPDGYKGDGRVNGTGCSDVDECAEGGWCPPNTDCANTVGSFTCACKSGFRNIGATPCGVICTDVDECNSSPAGTSVCGARQQCVNSFGSYTCQCMPGYSGYPACLDVDECSAGRHNCASQSSCVNVPGSFRCQCPAGFVGNAITPSQGGSGCSDINECLISNSCDANAACHNTQGSFSCVCNAGFAGDGYFCEDINECAGANSCVSSSNNGVCTNTVGSYKCGCRTGFAGNGILKSVNGGTGCTDINECTTGGSNCSSQATCTNTLGSFTCSCPNGYQGSGSSCYTVSCPNGTYPNSSTTCASCPAGTYNNQIGVEKCTPCPAGTFSTGVGKTSASTCAACPKNTYSLAGSSKCTTCSPGSVAPSTGSSTCQLCPAGQYGFQGVCKNCGAGWYSSAGATDCQPCPPGFYTSSSTATNCTVCPAGSISKGRAASCDQCPEGKYASLAGQFSCSTCPAGTQSSVGSTQCTACAAGSYAAAGSASCSPCAAGTYSDASGADVCKSCAPGSYQDMTGQAQCKLCSNWQYQDESGASSCRPCYQGYAGESEYGSKNCLSCPPGTFRTHGAIPVCTPCYAGSATELAGQPHCSYCMGGYYAKKCGQTSCDACIPGTYSSFVATGRDRCPYCSFGQMSFGTAYFCYY